MLLNNLLSPWNFRLGFSFIGFMLRCAESICLCANQWCTLSTMSANVTFQTEYQLMSCTIVLPETTKQITGHTRWRAMIMQLYGGTGCLDLGSRMDIPVSSWARASIARNSALTSILLKWLQKRASWRVRISCIMRWRANTMGMRRNSRTRARNRISRQKLQVGINSPGRNESQGIRVPKRINMLLLRMISMMVGRGTDFVFMLNHPSWAKPTPAPNEIRKSFEPRVDLTPVEGTASKR